MLIIKGNQITNAFEGGTGQQAYGINMANGAYNRSISDNNLSGNVLGPILDVSTVSISQQSGNTNSPTLPTPNTILGADVTTAQEAEAYEPWMLPNHGAANNFRMGFGSNCHWNGTAWQFETDTASNGG